MSVVHPAINTDKRFTQGPKNAHTNLNESLIPLYIMATQGSSCTRIPRPSPSSTLQLFFIFHKTANAPLPRQKRQFCPRRFLPEFSILSTTWSTRCVRVTHLLGQFLRAVSLHARTISLKNEQQTLPGIDFLPYKQILKDPRCRSKHRVPTPDFSSHVVNKGKPYN